MTTMGMRLQKLRPGVHTRARRHTGSKLYYVVRGSGTTIVDGQAYDWNAGDFFVIPPMAAHSFRNRGTEPAILFSITDLPTLEALDLYREEAYPLGDPSA